MPSNYKNLFAIKNNELHHLHVPQLKQLAANLGVKNITGIHKDELIQIITTEYTTSYNANKLPPS